MSKVLQYVAEKLQTSQVLGLRLSDSGWTFSVKFSHVTPIVLAVRNGKFSALLPIPLSSTFLRIRSSD
jgi:hypothetical protein